MEQGGRAHCFKQYRRVGCLEFYVRVISCVRVLDSPWRVIIHFRSCTLCALFGNFWTCPIHKCLLWLLFYLHLKYKSIANGLSNAIFLLYSVQQIFCSCPSHLLCVSWNYIVWFLYLFFFFSFKLKNTKFRWRNGNDHFKVIWMSQKGHSFVIVWKINIEVHNWVSSTLALLHQMILGI